MCSVCNFISQFTIKRSRHNLGPNKRVRMSHAVISQGSQTGNADRNKGSNGPNYPVMPGVFNVPRQFAFPSNIITRLRYGTVKILTTTALAGNVWRMNSIFDPDVTAAGHQPLYHDQFGAIYNHYTVIGSKLTARYVRLSGDMSVLVGINVDDDTTPSTTFETLMEQNKGVNTLLGLATGGTSDQVLTVTYGSERDEGIDPYAGGDLIRTAMGSNPAEVFAAYTWGISGDATTSCITHVDIQIEYTVLFSELITPTQS